MGAESLKKPFLAYATLELKAMSTVPPPLFSTKQPCETWLGVAGDLPGLVFQLAL